MKEKTLLLVQSRHFIWIFLVVVLATHIPTTKSPLSSDDFVQWAAMTSPASIDNLGLQVGSQANSFIDRITNSFLFFSAETNATKELKDYGAIPWWSPDDITMHMFRPISGVTHWIDYVLIGTDNMFLIKMHSVFYLLLLAFSYFILCKKLGAKEWVPALAVSFYAFSSSMPLNLEWLAARNAIISPIFGVWCLVFHIKWREQDNLNYLLASLVFLLLALLSAEAGVANLAYIGAYALLLDRHASIKNLITVIPAVVLVGLWRIYYSREGFGAENIGLYVDPVRSVNQFMVEQVPLLPISFLKLTTGLFSHLAFFISQNILYVSAVSLAISLILLGWIFPLIKKDRLLQFCILAAVVAAIPFLATFPGARMEPYLHIGFCLALSITVYKLRRLESAVVLGKSLLMAIVVVHLILPGVLTAARSWRLIKVENVNVFAYTSVKDDIVTGDENLVVVNPPDFFAYYNRPFAWAYNNWQLPQKIQLLVPGLTDIQIVRESEESYLLKSEDGLPLLADTPANIENRDDPKGYARDVLAIRKNNTILTNAETEFYEGQIVVANGFQIEILAMEGKLPISVRVMFTDQAKSVWQWFDWTDKKYKRFDKLAIGEGRYIKGPFG